MIIEGNGYESNYEEQMLRENEVNNLLSFYTIKINQQIQFWYDISGKRSLRDCVEQEGITEEMLEQFFRYMKMAYDKINQYLIQQEHIYLSPDAIYLNKKTSQWFIFLCYCPLQSQSVQMGLQQVIEYFLTMMNPQNENLTKTCYELYETSLHEEMCYQTYLDIFQDKETNLLSQEAINSQTKACDTIQPSQTDWKDNKKQQEVRSINKNFVDYLLDWVQKKGREWRQKIEQMIKSLFPEKVATNDFVFDPSNSIFKPTVLMKEEQEQYSGKLEYIGNQEESDYFIKKEIFCIGSMEEGNDAVLHSQAVSRHHARIIRQNGVYYIEDKNSTNGTYVNGSLLAYHETKQLYGLDEIRFGDVCYRIH